MSSDSISLISTLDDKIQLFTSFINKYRNIHTDMSALSDEDSRLSVIFSGLLNVQKAFKDIDSKIAIWVSNDPMYEIKDGTLNPTLVLTYVPRWPLVIFAITACFCMGSSAAYHLLQIHSAWLNELLSRLDYGGICFLIMGSSYPPIFYPFACKEVHGARNFFLALITTTSMSAFIFCMCPIFATPTFRPVRGFMFIILGLSAAAPMIYVGNYAPKEYIDTNTSVFPWALGGATYIGGAIIFVFRIPERYFPKKFDCFGSSH